MEENNKLPLVSPCLKDSCVRKILQEKYSAVWIPWNVVKNFAKILMNVLEEAFNLSRFSPSCPALSIHISAVGEEEREGEEERQTRESENKQKKETKSSKNWAHTCSLWTKTVLIWKLLLLRCYLSCRQNRMDKTGNEDPSSSKACKAKQNARNDVHYPRACRS